MENISLEKAIELASFPVAIILFGSVIPVVRAPVQAVLLTIYGMIKGEPDMKIPLRDGVLTRYQRVGRRKEQIISSYKQNLILVLNEERRETARNTFLYGR